MTNSSHSKIKWNEVISSMVGVKISRSKDGLELIQPNLINKILKETWDRKTVHESPLPEGFDRNFIAEESNVKPTEYLPLIGSLNYISIGTRPGITYAVNCLERFPFRPSFIHWKALKHLIGYLAETKERVLRICPSITPTNTVECYGDANWGGTQDLCMGS
ncbi:uncharacterized protein VP01_4154g1 [Puccinia sorghi]|uniref:Reverse transcriptase Ty1/copia-type domain-containing protein n=1 Tax=Puccinia sorghi TaxID=27349 RepID=A0A0L6URV1_9BASI|nr:uncharacterized protein VP01_4154g1 [Puccinia sorghi]